MSGRDSERAVLVPLERIGRLPEGQCLGVRPRKGDTSFSRMHADAPCPGSLPGWGSKKKGARRELLPQSSK
eukprot:1158221-Pyramimonas_sp.AAC.1